MDMASLDHRDAHHVIRHGVQPKWLPVNAQDSVVNQSVTTWPGNGSGRR